MTSYLFQTVSQSLRLAHAAENGFGRGHAIGWRFGRCHHGNTNEMLVTDASFYQTEAGFVLHILSDKDLKIDKAFFPAKTTPMAYFNTDRNSPWKALTLCLQRMVDHVRGSSNYDGKLQ